MGGIAVVVGVVAEPNIMWLIIVGIILLVIGGLCLIFIGEDIDLDPF
jgi:hypothetical protein